MDRDKIEAILSGEYSSDKNSGGGNGIGIGNVMSRLKLYYGQDNLFDIKSDGEDFGTEVLINIPKPKDPEDKFTGDEA